MNEYDSNRILDLTKKINEGSGNASYCDSFEEVTKALESMLQANDIILLMGPGNITSIAKNIIPLIKGKLFLGLS